MSFFSHSNVSTYNQILTARLIFEGSFEASFQFQNNVIFILLYPTYDFGPNQNQLPYKDNITNCLNFYINT